MKKNTIIFTLLFLFAISVSAQENLKPKDVVIDRFTAIDHDREAIARKGIKSITKKEYLNTRIGFVHEKTLKSFFENQGYLIHQTIDSAYHIEFDYNTQGDLLSEQGFYMKRDSITILIQEYVNYIYDDNGKLTNTQRKTASGGFGGTFYQISYNEEGFPNEVVNRTTEYILNKSYTELSIWKLKYDFTGRVEEIETDYYDVTASKSKKKSKIDTTYLSKIVERYTYNTFGNVVVRKEKEFLLKESLKGALDTTVNDLSELWVYKENKLRTVEEYAVEDGKPQNKNSKEYFYNEKGLITKVLFYDTKKNITQTNMKDKVWYKIEYVYEFY